MQNFKVNLVFSASQLNTFFSNEVAMYVNTNSDANFEMEIKPDFFIGDPPEYLTNSITYALESGTDAPAQYMGGIKIIAPAASDPTTSVPNQVQANEREWRTEEDSTTKPINF